MKYNNTDVWTMFDRVFKDANRFLLEASNNEGEIYHSSNFPPANIYLDKETKDLTFDFALAGYSREDIEITFEGDKMFLHLNPKEKKDDGKTILKKGFKTPETKTSFVIPSSKYLFDEAKAEMKDGILTVFIKAVDEIKPKRLLIS